MEITGIPSMAYAIVIFGYATAILLISLNRFIAGPIAGMEEILRQ